MTRFFFLPTFLLIACGGSAQSGSREGEPPADPISTESGQHLFEAGTSLATAGDFVRAEQYFSAAIQRGYPEERVIGPLVEVCVRSQRLRLAIGYAQPYLDLHPSVWQLRYLVASIQLGMGHAELARDELLRVIHDAPDSPDPHYLLADVLRELGGNDAAPRAELERYLVLAPTGRHAEEARAVLAGGPLPPVEHTVGSTPPPNHPIEHIVRPSTDAPEPGAVH